jgi:prepilin-type N-terminal cleavage/methylation domain-containing protein
MRARRCRDSEARAEDGFTLVEVLIAVWILGVVMVGLIGAIITMTLTSNIDRQVTAVEVELRHYADAVRTAPYKVCAQNSDYATPSGYTPGESAANPSINSVKYRNTFTNDAYLTPANAVAPTAFVANTPPGSGKDTLCRQSGQGQDDGVQLIDLQVKIGTVVRSTTILKRSPTVPGGN